MKYSRLALSAVLAMTSFAAVAADYPAPKARRSGRCERLKNIPEA
jgi:hypothetical protein